MTTPFISVDDLATFVGENLSETRLDLAIIAVDSACEAVRTDLNQHVNLVEDETVQLDGTGKVSLFLPELPVRSVSEVITYDADGEDETTLLAGTDYLVDKTVGILWRLQGETWPQGHLNIFVTYTHGWDLTEDVQPSGSGSGAPDAVERVPSDIRFVALQLAAAALSGGRVGVGGIRSESIDNYSYTLASDVVVGSFTPTLRRMLDRYRVEELA